MPYTGAYRLRVTGGGVRVSVPHTSLAYDIMNMPYTDAYRLRVGGVRVSLTRAALSQLSRGGGRSTELRLGRRSHSGRRLSQAQSCPSRPEQSESASDASDSFSCSCSAIPGVREHDARFGRDSDAVIRGGSQDGKDSSVTVPEGRLMSFSRKSWQIINLSFFSHSSRPDRFRGDELPRFSLSK
jgi:hypothetical protein